jgi:hypothetical protein
MCVHACTFLTGKQSANQNDQKTNNDVVDAHKDADDKHTKSGYHDAYHTKNQKWQHENWFLL